MKLIKYSEKSKTKVNANLNISAMGRHPIILSMEEINLVAGGGNNGGLIGGAIGTAVGCLLVAAVGTVGTPLASAVVGGSIIGGCAGAGAAIGDHFG